MGSGVVTKGLVVAGGLVGGRGSCVGGGGCSVGGRGGSVGGGGCSVGGVGFTVGGGGGLVATLPSLAVILMSAQLTKVSCGP